MSAESEPGSTSYSGGCHCGANKFTTLVSPPLDEGATVMACNCTICSRNGYLLAFVKATDTTWSAGGPEHMTTYTFNKKKFEHFFCPTCGTSLLVTSNDPDIFPGMLGLNVRAMEGVDVDKLKVSTYDGKSL